MALPQAFSATLNGTSLAFLSSDVPLPHPVSSPTCPRLAISPLLLQLKAISSSTCLETDSSVAESQPGESPALVKPFATSLCVSLDGILQGSLVGLLVLGSGRGCGKSCCPVLTVG